MAGRLPKAAGGRCTRRSSYQRLPGTEESIMTLLSITDLSAGFGEVSVLHGVTLNVPAGKVIALLGVNRAGKSKLLRTISGQISETSGAIEYTGQASNNQDGKE